MDTTTLIRKVRRSFGDDGQIFITDQDIIDWINDAQMQIARESPNLTAEITTAANTFPYTMPTDLITMMRVLYDIFPVPYTDVEDLDAKAANLRDVKGVPAMYYIVGGKLKLYPQPDTTDTTTVTLQYSRQPVDLQSSSDKLTVPVQFHEDIVRFCLARARERNEDYKGMEVAMQEFKDRISARFSTILEPDDTYPVIRDDAGASSYDLWGRIY
jgi:hypothetical protein